MERAAILIGVEKAGNLPKLNAVNSRLPKLAEWARQQGIPDNQIRILCDETGEVRIHQIKDTINELVGLATIEQLIVYFAGHGMNNRGEYWWLSRAPDDSAEAVNVEGSILLARYCGIPHVVLISDSCRTAAAGIQAQHLLGSDIFPNDMSSDERPVDAFFACRRGKPAIEMRDPRAAGSPEEFSALYTDELVACLRGERQQVIEHMQEDGESAGVVRAWRLDDYLRAAVPALLKEKLRRTPDLSQTPIARITSRNAWLARLPGRRRGRPSGQGKPIVPVSRKPRVTTDSLSTMLISAALTGDTKRWDQAFESPSNDAGTAQLRTNVSALSQTAPRPQFASGCGFRLRGTQLLRACSPGAEVEVLDADCTILAVAPRGPVPTSVLLEFQDGTGVLLPAVPEFTAELTFGSGQLAAVTYEPSIGSGRRTEYDQRAGRLRSLRAAIAASVSLGAFQLKADNALSLARQMQISKGVDPSMALYAAYAYHDLQRRDLINEMGRFMYEDLKSVFFDIALLSGKLGPGTAMSTDIVPHCPMLAQGWSLLSAFRVRLPGVLQDLAQHLLPSVWSTFDPPGVRKLDDAIRQREIQ